MKTRHERETERHKYMYFLITQKIVTETKENEKKRKHNVTQLFFTISQF